MTCINKIYSVSAMVGNGKCNANCTFCAGRCYRNMFSNKFEDDLRYYKNLEAAIKLSARYGGWSLSLTSAGEPTCDPDALTTALEVYNKCVNQGAFFPNVNLFTNGINFGNKDWCDKWLPTWKKLGLTNVAVSIHSTDLNKQAEAYGLCNEILPKKDDPHTLKWVRQYPPFEDIFSNIQYHGLGLRCTLLLSKKYVYDAESYEKHILNLINRGVKNITSWPIGNPDGSRNEFTPSRLGLFTIRRWLHKNAKFCMGHEWGGGVYDYFGNILRLTDYVTKHDPKKDFVRQLVVFHNGDVHYSWIREGSICLK